MASVFRPQSPPRVIAGPPLIGLQPVVLILCILLALALVNPLGYRGGGSDDWYYLQAARCAVATHGPCLPQAHWGARWPLVLPLAATIALFGETRTTLAGLALLYAMTAATLFTLLVQRQYGRTPAAIAGVILVVTPVFALQLTAINIETVELTYGLGALLCLQAAVRSGGRGQAAVAGALLGIAILSRTTSIVLIPIGLIGCWLAPALRRHAVPAAAGLGAVLGGVALCYAYAAGNPLLDWRLALSHAALPSTEIAAPIGAHELPLFNARLIAGWHRGMGIHVHWSIDALLNLLMDPLIGLTLLAAIGLMATERRSVPRQAWLIAGAAALYFGGLTYALAIDPKPRMFLPLVAAAAAIIGMLATPLWRRRARWPILAGLGCSAILAGATAYDSFRLRPVEPIVAAWAAEAPRSTEIDDTTRRAFTMIPAVDRLAVAPTVGRTRLLRVSEQGCAPSADGWRPTREARITLSDPAPIAALRARHILFPPISGETVCLFTRS